MTKLPRLLLLVAIFFTTMGGAAADKAAKTAKNLDALRARITAVREKVLKDTNKRDAFTIQLELVEKAIVGAGRKLRGLQQEISITEVELEKLDEQGKEIEARIEIQKGMLAEQIRAAYGMGNSGRIRLLLNQQDPAKAARALMYYDYLNKQRAKLIDSILDEERALVAVKQSILEKKNSLQQLVDKQQAAIAKLESNRSTREEVIKGIELRLASGDARLRKMLSDEKQLLALLASLRQALSDIPANLGNRKRFPRLKGTLKWPTKGRLKKKFGQKRAKGKLRWDGVLIKAKAGEKVRSVAYGRIAYADWLPRLGLLVIIDHGDNYMSLYAHNQAVFKKTGEWVEPGDVIAAVGDSGGLASPALYFEIRRKERPQNPAKWCRGKPRP